MVLQNKKASSFAIFKGEPMKHIKDVIWKTIIGGFVIWIPVVIISLVFTWIFNTTTQIMQPLTDLVLKYIPLSSELWANGFVILVMFAVSFIAGGIVKTRWGGFIYGFLEEKFFKKILGYTIIKETVIQLIGRDKNPFQSVAIVCPFGEKAKTKMTAFITDVYTNKDGDIIYTAFVPTSPNPTSGFVYHLPESQVEILDISIEKALRTILSCGVGSSELINTMSNKKK